MAHIPSIAKVAPITKVAKPLLSATQDEARRRVLSLYRMWQREAPSAIEMHALDMPLKGKVSARDRSCLMLSYY